jgi:uncharacterized RDD family membrane protein YckC
MKNIASVKLRIIAIINDVLIFTLFYLLAVLPVVSADNISGMFDGLVFLLLSVLFLFPVILSLSSIVLTVIVGGTLGKICSGIEIVDKKGNRVTLFTAFLRNYIGYIASGSFFNLGFIWVAIDKQRRGWHDMIADTYVVVKRKSGLLTGLITLIIVLFFNFILLLTISQQIALHEKIYQDTFTEIVDIVKESDKGKVDASQKYDKYDNRRQYNENEFYSY